MAIQTSAWDAARLLLRRFKAAQSGQIAIIFALASVSLVVAVGSGIDMGRAYVARQRMAQVATLTCQYSTRTSVVNTANTTFSGPNGFQTYKTAVNAFAANSLTSQHWSGTLPTDTTGGTNYFTATQASGSSNSSTSYVPSSPQTDLTSSIPTIFLKIANINSVPLHVHVDCATAVSGSPFILQDGFETTCTSYCFNAPNGANGTSSTPSSALTATPGYTGSAGAQFYITGYCLETDYVGVINSTVPEGTHSAELDCDNGSGSAGNSAISSKVYLGVGNYELRYNYKARAFQGNLSPAYTCASTTADVAWFSDVTTAAGRASRTNQINVYLDQFVAGSPPLHTTQDGTQQLSGTNLIDVCVDSANWVERSVKISVTTASYYWLSFAADGQSDSYGGQIDNLRFCQGTCPGTVQDNFPAAWVTSGLLFEDTFDKPTYTQDSPPHYIAKGGNMNLSLGTSGTSASGWPSQTASGWPTGPINQANYSLAGAYQGTQHITLDGNSSSTSTPSAPTNRAVSRGFVLDPGFYQVSYGYISMVDFSPSNVYGTYCYSAPSSGAIFPLTQIVNANGTIRYYSSGTYSTGTNIVGVFMSHSALISQPSAAAARGAAYYYTNPDNTAQGSAITFTNPNGTSATYPTLPTVPPDGVNWQNYDATQVNPVIDVCGYADSYRWIPRTVNVKITKPGLYWLTFSGTAGSGDSSHTGDGNGGGVDDVKLTALGSLFMPNPPTSALTTIPVPAPQPNSTYTNNGAFTGFSITADPTP